MLKENEDKTYAPPISQSDVEKAIQAFLAEKLLDIEARFYKTIDPSEEFGISRFVADRVYHMPQLLVNIELKRQKGTTTYILQSETKDSRSNRVRLEHRIQATSPEEAEAISVRVIKRLQGIQHKIWMAAWQLANQVGRFTYTSDMTKLMQLCHPERSTYFTVDEKIEFYEHLRSLENTKIIFIKKGKQPGLYEEHEIRLLEILSKVSEHEHYPEKVTITILNTSAFQKEKTVFVGAAIKHKTLELHADDSQLASWIQTRKSQLSSEEYIKVERSSLYRIAGLERTSLSNRSHANKLLMVKLKRLAEKGIILETPEKITEPVLLKVR